LARVKAKLFANPIIIPQTKIYDQRELMNIISTRPILEAV
jgi:hypothetical protein